MIGLANARIAGIYFLTLQLIFMKFSGSLLKDFAIYVQNSNCGTEKFLSRY